MTKATNLATGGDARGRGGLLERTFTKLLMRPARVIHVREIGKDFRLIDFESDALKGVSWSVGDKVQVKLDGGFITRTYTPICWDSEKGRTQFLAYCHGDGPGSDWAKHVAVGDERPFFGPRRSISTDGLGKRALLFGDETSFALALALERARSRLPGKRHYIFEVNDPEASACLLQELGLPDPVLIARREDDSHLEEAAAALLAVSEGTDCILTGKATSIQYVSRALKAEGVSTRALRTKAYWSPGKAGLD